MNDFLFQFWNFKTEISDLTNGTALARQWYVVKAKH